MATSNEHPNIAANWIDFHHRKPEPHPEDGSETLAGVDCGLKGPVTYRSRAGFTMKAQWWDLGPVEQWHYKDWAKRSFQ
jgi:hypothetical protein